MQAALAFVYAGELVLNNVPFKKCSTVDRDQEVSYFICGAITINTYFRTKLALKLCPQQN